MLSRHNSGDLKLTDEEANLLAMQSERVGRKFKVKSKPFKKGAFDFADMASFGLLPNEWRPHSQGQDIIGETGWDKFAGGVGSVAGLGTGIGIGTMASKIGWNALKKAFLRKKSDDIASNLYKGNLLGPGPKIGQIGQGSPLSLPGRPGVPQIPGGGRYPLQTTPNVGDVGRSLAGQRRRLDEAIAALRSNPYAQSMGIQQGGYIPGYQEGGEYPKIKRTVGIPGIIGGRTIISSGSQYSPDNYNAYDVDVNFPERNLWDKFTDFGKPWRDERNAMDTQLHMANRRPQIVPEELRDDPEYAYLKGD